MKTLKQSILFLYSQDLSNCTTETYRGERGTQFLYSQDLSNCTTEENVWIPSLQFLYSQDLSNCTTPRPCGKGKI